MADLLATATTEDPSVEHCLTTASFTVSPQRFAAWQEEQRRRQAEANTHYPM